MSMLAPMAQTIYGGEMSRYDEVALVLQAPLWLAALCSRPHVWRRQWQNVTIATFGSQTADWIVDLDWIEFMPDCALPTIYECEACCGIPEDTCAIHGIPFP